LPIAPSNDSIASLELERPTGLLQRFTLHPALRDFGLTGSTSFLVSVATMVVIAIVGRTQGPALLGEFLLIRRMASWLQGGVQLPSGVALPRYVAASINENLSTKQTYFVAALLTGCGIAVLMGAVLMIWRVPLSKLFFGSAELNHLILPLCLLLLGLAAHGAVFGYYQGTLEMGRACALQWINLIIAPILAIVLSWRAHSVALLVSLMGIFLVVGAFFFALPILRELKMRGSAGQLKKQASELFSYGIPRIGGDFGLQALLSLPAVIATHLLPIGAVAFLLLGGSFLTAVASATLPIAIILLSRISRSVAQMRTSQLRLQVTYFVSALIESSVFIGLQMIVFSDVIIKIWLGPSFLEGIRVIQITIIAVPFYFVYAGLRSVIDAAAVKAYNTQNILISLALFLAFAALVTASVPREHLLEALAASSVFGLAILAYCTLRTVQRLFQIDWKQIQILPGLTFAAILGMLSFSLHGWLHYQPGLIALLIFELAVTALYFVLLRLFGSRWVFFFVETMFLNGPAKQGSAE
jgi:O-antigen/teichoic acid export membrane protein